MKYHIPLTLLLAAVFFVGGCRKQGSYKIGVSQCSEDDWRLLMNEEIEREMMFHPEAVVEIRSADDSSQKQIDDIRYFIDNDFDIIIAAPNEADALTPVITQAYDDGIPVLVFDRSVHGRSYTAFQGADNAGIGAEAARYAHNLFPAGARVMELQGLPGSTPAAERSRGFRETADSLRSLRIVASAPADWNYDAAVRTADSLFSLHPDVDLVYAHNDRMALGAAEAAERRGLNPKIIGIDAAPDIGMKAVAEGKIDATFLYPTEGQQLIKTALAILNGEEYDKEVLMPASPAVDRSNVNLLLHQNQELIDETEHLKELKGEMDDYWNKHNSQTALLYACIAILVLVCVLLFLVVRTFWQNRRHHEQLIEKNRQLEEQRDLEKDLNRRLADATQSKLMFFTNVSHDLRTPLTLISEPVEQLAGSAALSESEHLLMRIADKNVKILRRLINQILDFRKFEDGKLDLHLEEADPALLAREWTDSFRALAAKKHIDFGVDIDLPGDFTMAFDVEKMERVAFNLLSNAFKYTPVKGKVDFGMCLEGERLVMTVKDTGKGIAAESLKNIFEMFYRADKANPEGSGIGLSLAKAFVELHGGTICAESEEGRGTEFIVKLPLRHVENIASEETLLRSANSAKEVASLLEEVDGTLPETKEENGGKPVVLVIDDNEDIRLMVKEILKDAYTVVPARDGKEGVRLAARYVPDAVICDVMMPGMDGMETCAAIKEEVTTSHIPLLMLTACSMDEQRVEGYESGADGYMSKPFNRDVLRARLASLIANRKRVKEVLGAASPARETAHGEGSHAGDVDNEFYSRFLETVRREMDNPSMSVDSLAETMGMGRSQFYRKIKALTGLSPVELIRDLRLKKARELLLTTDKTVSEIAYDVGFSTPAYFTKCYREVYSETPTALRQRVVSRE